MFPRSHVLQSFTASLQQKQRKKRCDFDTPCNSAAKAALNDVGNSPCSMRVASQKLASWSSSSANAQVTLGKSFPAYILSKDPIQTDIPKFTNAALEQKVSDL